MIIVIPRQNALWVHASRSGKTITRCNLNYSTAEVRLGRADEVTCPRCAKKVANDHE